MMRPLSILPALLLLALPAPSRSATLHVPGDYATIQAATAAAVADDTVEVACGTYYESGIFVGSNVVLRSATGQAACVTIDGSSEPTEYAIVTCTDESTVEGFLITRGLC